MPTTTFQHSAENDSREEVSGGTSLTQLIAVATTVLQQAIDLVENVLTADDQLTTHSKYLPGSTIGTQHKFAIAISTNENRSVTSIPQGNICAMRAITSCFF